MLYLLMVGFGEILEFSLFVFPSENIDSGLAQKISLARPVLIVTVSHTTAEEGQRAP